MSTFDHVIILRKMCFPFAFSLVAACTAWGDTYYLKTKDNGSNLTAPSHWTNVTGQAAVAFGADDVFMVHSGINARTPDSLAHSFAGGELHLGSGGTSGQLNIYTKTLEFSRIVLDRGVLAQQGNNGASYSIDGTLCVVGDNNVMRWLYSRQTMTLKTTLKGETSAKMATDVRYVGDARFDRTETLILAGDCSGFAGTLTVTPSRGVGTNKLASDEFYVKLVLATDGFAMPGSITVANGCALEVTAATATVGNLTMNSGSRLFVPATPDGGGLVVTDSLTLPSTLRIVATRTTVPSDGATNAFDVLTAPAGVVLDPNNFVFEEAADSVQYAKLGVRTENGRQTLRVTFEPVVEMTESDGSSLGRAGTTTGSTAWSSETAWSDDKAPHTNAHYVVRMRDGNAMYFRTPSHNANYTFPGDSLTIGTNSFLRIFQSGGYNLTIGRLRLLGGSEVDVGQSTYSHLYGNVYVDSGVVRFGICGNSLNLHSPISGTGDIWFSGPDDGTSTPYGTFALSADNSGFRGRIRVEYCRVTGASYATYRQEITADSELQLGGQRETFDPKALTLRKYGRLTTRGSFALTTAYNRGVFVDGAQGGVFNVANKVHVLTLGTQLTLNGTLYKDGAGTLVMGGSVKFGSDVVDMPTEGANLFVVTNGLVKVTAADALNGLATTFASGTSLVLAIDPDNADLTRYGIRNVKTDNPFAVAAGETLPFSLEASAAVKAAARGRAMDIGLFTVTSEADKSFRSLMPDEVRSPIPSSKGTVVRREADDVVIYSLAVTPLGLKVIFR